MPTSYPHLTLKARATPTLGLAALALATMSPLPVPALGPHELLLIVNQSSEVSVEIADAYARLRRIPAANIIRIRVPKTNDAIPIALSPEHFTTLIWEPVQETARRRGIDGHSLAWVYSAGFPVRVATSPAISLTGATFVRNRIPSADTIKKGAYANPLFAGPLPDGSQARLPQTLDVARAWLGDAMPLPAMMLGVAGPNANSVPEILASLRRGRAADATRPGGTVYFVLGDDVRARTRAWQFKATAAELKQRGIQVKITTNFPENQDGIIGLISGAATVVPTRAGHFRPGAMADHLTSFAAAFDNSSQTRLSAWIHAGATLSAGTVTEPYALWQKFPHARYFVHYTAGCTALESFSQALRSPLQTLCVGDPLAQPWAPDAALSLERVERGSEPRSLIATLSLKTGPVGVYRTFVFLLDGRPIENVQDITDPVSGSDNEQRRFLLTPVRLESGLRTLRAVAYGAGSVRHQIFDEQPIRY